MAPRRADDAAATFAGHLPAGVDIAAARAYLMGLGFAIAP